MKNNEMASQDHISITRMDAYDMHACRECGACLAACPYVNMSAGRARREMRRLRRGAHSILLERCVGCATCDAVCPTGNRPYSLIRMRWFERFQQRGLPRRARFLMPHSTPNFRTVIRLDPGERAYVNSIARPAKGPRVLYAGCNALLLPQQLRSGLFSGLEVMGAFEYCCGEMYYRMGMFDHARQCALRLQKLFRDMAVREMYFVCSACYNMLANVYPREFGVHLDFEKHFADDWVRARLRDSDVKIRRPLDRKITLHDSCHAKLMGGTLWESTRELARDIGGEVVECEHTRETSLCCGVAAGCSRQSPLDIVAAAARRLWEFDRSGAAVASPYCNGCFLTLEAVRQALRTRVPVRPLWDLASQAVGEALPQHPLRDRPNQMLQGILMRFPLIMLSATGRYRPGPIQPLGDDQAQQETTP